MLLISKENDINTVHISVEEWFETYYKVEGLSDNKVPYIAVAGRCGIRKEFYYSVRFPISEDKYITWPETFFSFGWHQIKIMINSILGEDVHFDESRCDDIPPLSNYTSSNVVSILTAKK